MHYGMGFSNALGILKFSHHSRSQKPFYCFRISLLADKAIKNALQICTKKISTREMLLWCGWHKVDRMNVHILSPGDHVMSKHLI